MSKIIEIHDALMLMLPENTIFSVEDNDYNKITFQSEGVVAPSQSNVQSEITRLQALEDANAYKQKRVAEYPSMGDQLDALFHAGVFPEDMATQIQAVKDKYPKAGK